MNDVVSHPSHYAEGWSNGAEVIDITENLNFNRGNAVKYIARAGKKNPDAELEDLRKAKWYLEREIYRLDSDEARDPILEHRMALDVVDLDEPQVWSVLSSVPFDFSVTDRHGWRWDHDGASWGYTTCNNLRRYAIGQFMSFAYDDRGPFIEIKEAA